LSLIRSIKFGLGGKFVISAGFALPLSSKKAFAKDFELNGFSMKKVTLFLNYDPLTEVTKVEKPACLNYRSCGRF
jgi:hypothetical protein